MATGFFDNLDMSKANKSSTASNGHLLSQKERASSTAYRGTRYISREDATPLTNARYKKTDWSFLSTAPTPVINGFNFGTNQDTYEPLMPEEEKDGYRANAFQHLAVKVAKGAWDFVGNALEYFSVDFAAKPMVTESFKIIDMTNFEERVGALKEIKGDDYNLAEENMPLFSHAAKNSAATVAQTRQTNAENYAPVRQFFEEKSAFLEEVADTENQNEVVKFLGNLAESTPYTLTAFLTNGAGIVLNYGAMHTASYKQKLAEKQASGQPITQEDLDNIELYASGAALVEAASEQIFTLGLLKLAGKSSAKVFAKTLKTMPMKNAVAHIAKYWVKNGLEEGAEEVISEIGQGTIAKFTTNKDEPWWDESDPNSILTAKSIGIAGLGGFVMGSTLTMVNSQSAYNDFKNSRALYEEVKDIPLTQLTADIQARGKEAVMQDLMSEHNRKVVEPETKKKLVEADQNSPIGNQIERLQNISVNLDNNVASISTPQEEAIYKVAKSMVNNSLRSAQSIKAEMKRVGSPYTPQQIETRLASAKKNIAQAETDLRSATEGAKELLREDIAYERAQIAELEAYQRAFSPEFLGKEISMDTKRQVNALPKAVSKTRSYDYGVFETAPEQYSIMRRPIKGDAKTWSMLPTSDARAKTFATLEEATRALGVPMPVNQTVVQDTADSKATQEEIITDIVKMRDDILKDTSLSSESAGRIKMKLQMFSEKYQKALAAHPEFAKNRRVHGFITTLTQIMEGDSVADVQKLFEDRFDDLTYAQLANAEQIEISDNLMARPDATKRLEEMVRKFYNEPMKMLEPNQVVSLSRYFDGLTKSTNEVEANVGFKGLMDLSQRMTMAGQMGQSARAVIEVFGGYRHGKAIADSHENLAVDNVDKQRVRNETKKTKRFIEDEVFDDAYNEVVKGGVKSLVGTERNGDTAAIDANTVNGQKPKMVDILSTMIKNNIVPFDAKKSTADTIARNVLFQKYLEKNPSRKGKEKNVFKTLAIMALDSEKYGNVWDEVKPLVEKKLAAENAKRIAKGLDTIEMPENYMKQLRDPVFSERLMNQAMRKVFEYNDTTLAIETRKYFLEGGISQRTIDRFVDTLRYKFEETYGQKMPDETFAYIQKHFTEHFKKSMTNVRNKIRNKMELQVKGTQQHSFVPGKTKIEKSIDELTDAVISGAFADDTLNAIWAKRLGVNYLTEEMRSEIIQSIMKIDSIADEDARSEAFNDFMATLAHKVDASNVQKFNAWRRFSMLCSPKTWTRNGISNYAYVPYSAMTDRLTNGFLKALKVDSAAQIYGDKYIKQGDNAEIDAAVLTYIPDSKIRAIVSSNTKYELKNHLREEGRIFKTDWIEKLTKGPLNMITTGGWAKDSKYKIGFFGDTGILAVHLRSAFRNKLNAMGYKASLSEDVKQEMVDKALEYAKRIALTRTYRTASVLTDKILKLKSNTNQDSKINEYLRQAKIEQDRGDIVASEGYLSKAEERKRQLNAANVAIDIAIPFVVTPVAIATEAYRFSPVALGVSLFKIAGIAKRGEIKSELHSQEVAHVTAQLSQALVGTAGQWMFGTLLALAGLVTGAPPTSEKEKEAWALEGKTAYSFFFPGIGWISYSWCQPVALGIMAGADAGMAIKNGGYDIAAIPSAIDAGLNGMIGLTFYENIRNLWKGRTPSENLKNFATSGLYQLFPVAAKQLAQSFDPYVRDSYSGNTFQILYQRAISYLPGLSMTQPMKIDIWGNPVKSQDAGTGILGRSILNLLSPFTLATPKKDNVSNEVIRLFNSTGDTSCLPVVANPKWDKKVGNETYSFDLSGQEYVEYQKLMGEYAYGYANKVMASGEYLHSSDEKKVALLKSAYAKASDRAKSDYIEIYGQS